MPAYKEPVPPQRPVLPLTFWLLVATVLAEQGVLRSSWESSRFREALVPVGMAALATVLIMAIHGHGEAARFTMLIAASLCAGAVLASLAVDAGHDAADALSKTPVSTWSFSVTGDARAQNGRYRMRARVRSADGASADVWLLCGERLHPGMEVTGVGRLQPFAEGSWADASRAQGIAAQVSLVKIDQVRHRGGLLGLIDGARMRLIDSLESDESPARALIAACTLGERSGLDALGLESALRRCGVSHLVAVSGTHLGIVAAALAAGLDKARTRARVRSAALVCATGLFVLLCGASASAVRAWIMVIVHASSVFAHRRSHGLSALCAAALAMALLDPCVTGQLAYQLSVAAVLGIYVVNPYMRYLLEVLFAKTHALSAVQPLWRRLFRGAGRGMLDLLSLSLTAQLVTLPIAASAFSELSLVAPAANLAASPLIAALTMAGLLACVLMPLPIAQAAVLAAAEPIAQLLAAILESVSGLWFAAIPMPPFAQMASLIMLALALVLAWRAPPLRRAWIVRPLAALLGAVMLWYGCNRYAAPARLVVLDVGQGDAILIQEGPYAVLVDAGPAGPLDEALMRNAVFHVDAVIISHLHNDHYGGVADLVGRVPCDRIYVAAGSAAQVPDELSDAVQGLGAYPVQEMAFLDEVSFGHFRLTAVAPAGAVDGLENEDSMFLLVSYDDGRRTLSALLTGDGESAELAGVLARINTGGMDILKVGHHGSDASITHEQAAALAPTYALCSAGANNGFGHPHPSTVEALEQAGAIFICTKDAGDIVMTPAPGGVQPARRVGERFATLIGCVDVVQFDGYG